MVFDPESLKCFRIDLKDGIENAKVEKLTDVVGPQLLNGMAGIPENPHILLSLDSIDGSVVRINAKSGKVDVPIQDVLLQPSEDKTKVPLGANGTKIRDGHLYFTNSAKEIFGRIPIDAEGNQTGSVEVLVSNEESDQPFPYDDFDFSKDGTAYLTRHPDAVFKVVPEKAQQLFLGGTGDDSILKSPTSLTVSDARSRMYITCGGKIGEFNGFIVEVNL